MKQRAKAGAFNKRKFISALREETPSLIGAFVLASMSLTAFQNYAKHHSKTLFAGWMLAALFVLAVSFTVRNIIRASRENEKGIIQAWKGGKKNG